MKYEIDITEVPIFHTDSESYQATSAEHNMQEPDLDATINRLLEKYGNEDVIDCIIEFCGAYQILEQCSTNEILERIEDIGSISPELVLENLQDSEIVEYVRDLGYLVFEDEEDAFDIYDNMLISRSVGMHHASCFRNEALRKIEEFVEREGWNKLYEILNETER